MPSQQNLSCSSLPSLPSAPIKVQEMAGSRPQIVVRPADTASPYNKRAVITCEAIGRPTPTARWLKNGRQVPDGARYMVEAADGVYRLIIREVWDIDAGDYTCELSNVFGTESATATLKVQGGRSLDVDGCERRFLQRHQSLSALCQTASTRRAILCV